MTAQKTRLATILLVIIACAMPVQADCLEDFCVHVAKQIKRRNCWPKPFVCPDRHTVRVPFAIMVNNGWRSQNMLADHHFEPNQAELTESGRLKVQWIVNEAPSQHRTIYVHRTKTPELTAARVNATQDMAAQLSLHGQPTMVLETNAPAPGWPAFDRS